ncbi:MAG: MarR family winged helix-turn-helix transcriptional regulator [Phototrophicaceae bacterium]
MNDFSETSPLEEQFVESFHRLRNKLIANLSVYLRGYDLTPVHVWLMHELDEAQKPLSFSQLAEALYTSRSNLTQLVDRMESDDLVRRVPHPEDRRSVLVELTPKGQERVKEARLARNHSIHELLSALTEAEQHALIHYLKKLCEDK